MFVNTPKVVGACPRLIRSLPLTPVYIFMFSFCFRWVHPSHHIYACKALCRQITGMVNGWHLNVELNEFIWVESFASLNWQRQKMQANRRGADAAVRCGAHCLMKHILSFTRSHWHWMPSSGKCLHHIPMVTAMVMILGENTKHYQKTKFSY